MTSVRCDVLQHWSFDSQLPVGESFNESGSTSVSSSVSGQALAVPTGGHAEEVIAVSTVVPVPPHLRIQAPLAVLCANDSSSSESILPYALLSSVVRFMLCTRASVVALLILCVDCRLAE